MGLIDSGKGHLPGPAVEPAELIASSGADVLVEATVLERGGNTAARPIEAAFASGMDVVTVNKGPVAWQFERMAAAETHGRRWRYEGTVADGMTTENPERLSRSATPVAKSPAPLTSARGRVGGASSGMLAPLVTAVRHLAFLHCALL